MKIKRTILLASTCLVLASCVRERESVRTYQLRFSEGLAPIMQDGKWGYINSSGGIMIQPHFDRVQLFSEGLAQVRFRGSWQYIDLRGRIVLSRSGGSFRDGLAASRDHRLCWGFMDPSGSLKIATQYELVKDFYEERAAVKATNGLWGYVDTNGQTVVDMKHQTTWGFHEGLASCGIAGDITYINIDGEVEIDLPDEMTRGLAFSEGMALISIGQKNGYISRDGTVVIQPDEKYSYWHWFSVHA